MANLCYILYYIILLRALTKMKYKVEISLFNINVQINIPVMRLCKCEVKSSVAITDGLQNINIQLGQTRVLQNLVFVMLAAGCFLSDIK